MKVTLVVAASVSLITTVAWIADHSIAPLFLNSRIERLGEKNLPKISVERRTVYCRMKADDFSFALPPESRGTNTVISGGFDIVDGTVEAIFEGSHNIPAYEYENWLSGKVQEGSHVTAQSIPKGLLIKFRYFGDK
ncbi:MAG TPA: hypothetical protein VH597_03545 [Verrucomicrobiae bacterium]|nr:hypothetical protein [Verrucomicrobiae bacterium]